METAAVLSIAVHPKYPLLVYTTGRKMTVWDIRDKRNKWETVTLDGSAPLARFTEDGKRLCVLCEEKLLCYPFPGYEAIGKMRDCVPRKLAERVQNFALHPDGIQVGITTDKGVKIIALPIK